MASAGAHLIGRHERPVVVDAAPTGWSTLDRTVGLWACRAFFLLSSAYVPAMLAGFVANGGLRDPVRDPYLAIMELLILPLAVAMVVVFAAVHSYAGTSRTALSLSALALATVAAGLTVCVHLVLLTVGRQSDAGSLPGYDRLLSWTWPSAIYALDIAAWDFFLGAALILAAPVFTGSGRARTVRRGLQLSGSLCLAGLAGAALDNMLVRDIGIVGYALVLPVVLLVMARQFAGAPAVGSAP